MDKKVLRLTNRLSFECESNVNVETARRVLHCVADLRLQLSNSTKKTEKSVRVCIGRNPSGFLCRCIVLDEWSLESKLVSQRYGNDGVVARSCLKDALKYLNGVEKIDAIGRLCDENFVDVVSVAMLEEKRPTLIDGSRFRVCSFQGLANAVCQERFLCDAKFEAFPPRMRAGSVQIVGEVVPLLAISKYMIALRNLSLVTLPFDFFDNIFWQCRLFRAQVKRFAERCMELKICVVRCQGKLKLDITFCTIDSSPGHVEVSFTDEEFFLGSQRTLTDLSSSNVADIIEQRFDKRSPMEFLNEVLGGGCTLHVGEVTELKVVVSSQATMVVQHNSWSPYVVVHDFLSKNLPRALKSFLLCCEMCHGAQSLGEKALASASIKEQQSNDSICKTATSHHHSVDQARVFSLSLKSRIVASSLVRACLVPPQDSSVFSSSLPTAPQPTERIPRKVGKRREPLLQTLMSGLSRSIQANVQMDCSALFGLKIIARSDNPLTSTIIHVEHLRNKPLHLLVLRSLLIAVTKCTSDNELIAIADKRLAEVVEHVNTLTTWEAKGESIIDSLFGKSNSQIKIVVQQTDIVVVLIGKRDYSQTVVSGAATEACWKQFVCDALGEMMVAKLVQ